MKYEKNVGFSSPREIPQLWPPATTPSEPQVVERVIKKLISERRKRYAYFSADLFADPAWDILLVVALAEARQQRLTVTRICERVDGPTTTTLRWLNKLTDEGLLVRRDDLLDRRRKYIELSPAASSLMIAYCSTSETSMAA